MIIIGVRVVFLMFGMVYVHDLETGYMFRTIEGCLLESDEGEQDVVPLPCSDIGADEGWKKVGKIRFDSILDP